MTTPQDESNSESPVDPIDGAEQRLPKTDWQDRWMDELLMAARPSIHEDADHELRIQKLLAALDAPTHRSIEPCQHDLSSDRQRPLATSLLPRRRWAKWVTLTLASSIILMLFFVFQQSQTMRQALAVVQKSLQAADEIVPRHYAVTTTFVDRQSQTLRSVACDLYVCGGRQYALRHPALVGTGDLWIGRNGDSTWVVPARGPVRVGDETALHRWLEGNQDLTTPYLHVTSLLQRLSRGYRLQEQSIGVAALEWSTVVTDKYVVSPEFESRLSQCRRISGTRIDPQNTQNPEQIELWCDRETGMALRVVAIWDPQANPRGRRSLVIDFVASVDVSPEWFEHSGHYQGRRMILNFD